MLAAELGIEFGTGLAAGVVVDAFALEPNHLIYAHRDGEALNKTYALGARVAIAVATGISTNRTTLGHRLHHAELDADPMSAGAAYRQTLTDALGQEVGTVDITDSRITFPGLTIDDDPLLKQEEGVVSFRHDPAIEQFVGQGGWRRMMPLAAVTIGLTAAYEAVGRKESLPKAAAFAAGLAIGAGGRFIIYGVAEHMAGKKDGQFNTESLPRVLRPFARTHQRHHDHPERADASGSALYQGALKLLEKAGLARFN